MKNEVLMATAAPTAMVGVAKADPVGFSHYVNTNGFINVQDLE